jgi:phosphoglycolate phosphatase-like HAD superfamily hydrolase
MIEKIAIYDLDGTIIDSSHRYRTAPCGTKIDLLHWREHDIPEFIEKDKLLPLAEQYLQDINCNKTYVIAATARACIPNDATYKFLDKHLKMPNRFIHRQGVNDNRGGAQLKIQAIKPLLNLKPFKNAVVHIYEDNQKYLQAMCHALNGIPHYIPSVQGH